MTPVAFNPSNIADSVLLLISAISVFILVAVTAVMIIFVVKYREGKNPKAEQIEGSLPLEIAWTVIPTILALIMFYAGWSGFEAMRKVPEGAMEIRVTARMWEWMFEYENGKESEVLKVPSGTPVKLSLTSEDVIHSLYIPVFRVKEDAVPEMETYLWFLPEKEGSYRIFCAEYCGEGHSRMLSRLDVLAPADFEAWYSAAVEEAPSLGRGDLSGEILLEEKRCLSCHSTDGSRKVGPSFQGIFGRKTTVLTAGKEREIVADEEYLYRSILDPKADILKTYPPVMPPQEGRITEEEAGAIIDYLKTLQ